jgi:endonuclease/exonuclease/phosphatase family metal-dependent hydrolase
MCNGGYFDYMNTWFDPYGRYSDAIAKAMPLDYVITSNNVVCNRFKVYTEEWFNLYSDHTPIVANLTLLETI